MKTSEENNVVMDQEVVTWEQVNAMVAQKKDELKALKALLGGSTRSGASVEERRARTIERWRERSPLGAELLYKEVSFKPFGQTEPLNGVVLGLVEDKRVPTVLVKILADDGKAYHKDHKSINTELFALVEGKLRVTEAKEQDAPEVSEVPEDQV